MLFPSVFVEYLIEMNEKVETHTIRGTRTQLFGVGVR